jgi:hypothetical protein
MIILIACRGACTGLRAIQIRRGAGAKAKTMTSKLPILSVSGKVLFIKFIFKILRNIASNTF